MVEASASVTWAAGGREASSLERFVRASIDSPLCFKSIPSAKRLAVSCERAAVPLALTFFGGFVRFFRNLFGRPGEWGKSMGILYN